MAETAQPRAMRRPNKVSPRAAAEEEYGGAEPGTRTKQPHPAMAAAAVSRRLTVWCKSLVFHGDGYAVFDDADGRMVFRVDNYGVGEGSMALMDHAGRVLLTVRRRRHRKMLRLAETWEVYKGDADADAADAAASLVMRADKDLCNSSCTASVLGVAGGGAPAPAVYRMSWSRREEWFRIYRSGGAAAAADALVAEVRRKRGGPEKATLLGKDVLSLVVQPGMDDATAMAMLMISNSYR